MKSVTYLLLSIFAAAVIGLPTVASGVSFKIQISNGTTVFTAEGMDTIEAFVTGGNNDFTGDGFDLYSPSNWSANALDVDYALATGQLTDPIQFELALTGEPYTVDFLFWDGGVFGDLVKATRVSKNGWSLNVSGISNIDVNSYSRPEAIPSPEPATMLFIGAGLIGIAAAGRKKFSKKMIRIPFFGAKK